MISTNLELIRQDRVGRLRFNAAQRRAFVDAFENSGMSGPQFAAHHGLKYQTFATWLQKRKRATGAYPALNPHTHFSPLLLAEVETPPSTEEDSATPLEIRLPGGSMIFLSNSSQLPFVVALLRELSASQPC